LKNKFLNLKKNKFLNLKKNKFLNLLKNKFLNLKKNKFLNLLSIALKTYKICKFPKGYTWKVISFLEISFFSSLHFLDAVSHHINRNKGKK
jgi:hypothetical protein